MPPFTLQARYVFPVVGSPIPDGTITIDEERIVALGSGCGEGEIIELGNVAILPGLVNAHAHLDFSDLTKPLGEPGIGFVDWIRLVMDRRSNSRELAQGINPILHGLHETLQHGVTTLGEIAQPGWSVEPWSDLPLRATIFQECIAPTLERVPDALESAKSHTSCHDPTPPHCNGGAFCSSINFSEVLQASNFQAGLGPHAPFSVHPELLSALISLSTKKKIPLAMHLAESREEIELLRHGTGPLRKFLEEIGAWDTTAIRTGTRPLEYLKRLASAHRALVIHGGFLDDEEIAFLGGRADRMSVVYCPRTHDWFARGDYPLERMLTAGVTVALGTDGRGSSPDLSLLAEMRFAAQRHPAVGGDRILQMGTLDGAKALGWDQHVGSLEPGKQADLAIVALSDRETDDPYALLLESEKPVVGHYFRGVKWSPLTLGVG